MYPDLISRSLGFIGVFITLVAFDLLYEHKFQIQVQDTYSTLVVNINHEKQLIQEIQKTKPAPQSRQDEETVEKVSEIKPVNKSSVSEKSVIKPKPEVKDNTIKKQAEPLKKVSDKVANKTNTAKKNVEIKQKSSSKTGADKKTHTSKSQDTAQPTQKEVSSQDVNKSRQTISNLIFDKIQDKIQYPQRAIKRKIQGIVLVEFNVVNGKITSFTIIKSSGHAILDKSATKLCKELIGFDTKHQNSNIKIHMPIKYALI